MINRNNYNKILILVFSIFSFILLCLAGSYAFFSYKGEGNNTVSLTTNDITFKYKEGTNSISLNGAMPMSSDTAFRRNDNYFDFEIDASVPNGFSVPYYITARKTENSDNIDDAIMIGLSSYTINEQNIYDTIASTRIIEITGWENYPFFYQNYVVDEVLHHAGDTVVGDKYFLMFAENDFESLSACRNDSQYILKQNFGLDPQCQQLNDSVQHRLKYRLAMYDSLEACEADARAVDDCVLAHTNGDTYDYDVIRVVNWNGYDYDSLEICEQEQGANNCLLRYRPGEKTPERIIGTYSFSDLAQYEDSTIDLSNFTEKLLYSAKVSNVSDYVARYRVRIWLDEDTDFTQAKYNNASFGVSINVYSKGKTRAITSAPGLYDSNNNLLASWDQLVNIYGLDVTYNYYYADYECDEDYIDCNFTNPTSMDYIIDHNPEFANATKLVIGNVEEIGNYAFYHSKLREIVIPDTVTDIGDGAFAYSSQLNSVILSGNLIEIGLAAFCGDSSLTSIEIPSSLTRIRGEAFEDCTALTNVILETPSFLNTVDKRAFMNTAWYNTESQNDTVDVYLNGILLSNETGGR